MIDTHAHYDDPAFDPDREDLLDDLFRNAVVRAVITVGCAVKSCNASVALAESRPDMFAAVGFHPEFAQELDLGYLREICRHPKVVAIGEIGLDYHYDGPEKSVQKEALHAQLSLAESLSLPVVIHDRDAHADILDAVRAHPSVRGVFHSYSGSWEMARELLKLGWYVSFSGVVTFKNARQAVEVAKNVPNDRFLTETDCPYLSPVPFRGQRNDSGRMRKTLEALADIRNVSFEEIERQTESNAIALFGLPLDPN
ncbi:MAG: TatD family hydrolase [Clostridia bacterium]|nr:TatD family hydrolase [Clostridia bacterium]